MEQSDALVGFIDPGLDSTAPAGPVDSADLGLGSNPFRPESSTIDAIGFQAGIATGTMGHGRYFHGGRSGIAGQDQYAGKPVGWTGILVIVDAGCRVVVDQSYFVQGFGMEANQRSVDPIPEHGLISARESGLARCTYCGLLQPLDTQLPCARCKATVNSRRNFSLQRTWAFLVVGLLAYIPANIRPIMSTRSLTGFTEDTIISGIISLASSGSYSVAIIVFIASFCIPVTKFIIIAGLALSLHFAWDMPEHRRHQLHTLTEFIGRWSMIDVFVVAVLAALIQLGAVLTITPGIGINAFAASVVFTMMAASSLDPRLLWDNHTENEQRTDH